MKTFVLYEIWTTSRVVTAESQDDALENGEPVPGGGGELSLANWYAVEVTPDATLNGPRAIPRSVDAVVAPVPLTKKVDHAR